MKRDYSKEALIKYAYENHGQGVLDAYGEEGHAGTYIIRTSHDLELLPEGLAYVWQS